MTDNEQFAEFPLDYYNEFNDDLALYDEVERRLLELRGDHDDMTGATVTIRHANQGTESGIEVTITVSISPDTVSVTSTAPEADIAVKSALDSIARKVREQRDRLRGY